MRQKKGKRRTRAKEAHMARAKPGGNPVMD